MEYEIIMDENPINPREDCNIGTMLCNYDKYVLGDVKLDFTLANNWEEELAFYFSDKVKISDCIWGLGFTACNKEYEKIYNWIDENINYLPLNLYDHGGVSLSIGSSSGWDNRQIGWIYCKKTDGSLELLEEEVKAYNSYLSGQMYCYIINGEYTCGFTSLEEAENAAKEAINAMD